MSESKNKSINHAQINWSDQSEPISTLFDDIYFNTEQGLNESLYVFIQGNNLAQRWLDCETQHFSIAETGFGTGLNFLITCLQFQHFTEQHPDALLTRLHFTSFEKYPLTKADLETALQKWPQLDDFIAPLLAQYPLAITGCHRITLDKFNITLDLWFGDVLETLPSLFLYNDGLFDCWYLDGFAPSKNPEMWSDSLFRHIAKSCRYNATIATFTAAGFVRRGLIAAGFTMHKRKGYGKKREMLVGQLTTKGSSIQQNAQSNAKDVAIIGDEIESACLSLALVKRGYKVTVYSKNSYLAEEIAEDQQTALYPLLNGAHDISEQLFANSFLYARNYVELINQFSPFTYDLSGLQQSYCEQKQNKILQAQLPPDLVQQATSEQSSLYYKLAGRVDLKQMVQAIFKKAKNEGELSIKFNHQPDSLSEGKNGWELQFSDQRITHPLLVLTTALSCLTVNQDDPLSLFPEHKDSATADNLPYAGALTDDQETSDTFYNKLFLLTGLGTQALCTAPLLSEMLASQINKEPLPFPIEILNALQTNLTKKVRTMINLTI